MQLILAGLETTTAREPEAHEWRADLATIQRYRLSAVALWHAQRSGWRLPEDVMASLEASSRQQLLVTMAADSTAGLVAKVLNDEGVPFVIIKGPGLANLYQKRELRPYSDLDVLVAKSDFARTLRLFASHGLVAPTIEARPYVRTMCREAVNLIGPGHQASVDLHQMIPPWFLGRRLPFEHVLARARVADVLGVRAPLASPLDQLMIASLHLLSDKGAPGKELIIWRDVMVAASVVGLDAAMKHFEKYGLGWWFRSVLDGVAGGEASAGLSASVATGHRLSGWRVNHLLPGSVGSRHQIALAIRIPIPRALAFLFANLIPSTQFLRSRYGRRLALLRWWRDCGGKLLRAALGESPAPRIASGGAGKSR